MMIYICSYIVCSLANGSFSYRYYSNSVSFIELLRIFASVCAKIFCSEKELLNLKDLKLTQKFYSNKTGFVRSGHICRIPFRVSLLTQTVVKQWFSYRTRDRYYYTHGCIFGQ